MLVLSARNAIARVCAGCFQLLLERAKVAAPQQTLGAQATGAMPILAAGAVAAAGTAAVIDLQHVRQNEPLCSLIGNQPN